MTWIKKKEFIAVALLLIFSFLIRFYRLDFKEGGLIFDEANGYGDHGYRNIVLTYLKGEDDPNFMHPPLGKEILALGFQIFGDNAYGWRLPSVIFSVVSLLVIYLLIKEITKSRIVAFLTTLFVSLDFIYFIHSRLLTMEMIYLFFFWISVYFFWRFWKERKNLFLWLGGLSFGAALATKWTAMLILIPFFFSFLLKKEFREVFKVLVVISVVGMLVYTLSYLPFILRHSFSEFINIQTKIFKFWFDSSQEGLKLDFLTYLQSHAFVWPLNPPWIYEQTNDEGKTRVIWSMFNPVLFYFSEIFLIKDFLKRKLIKNYGYELLFVGAFVLPWLLVTRNQYLYYALPAIPFLYAYLAKKVRENYQRDKWWSYAFVATLITVCIYFYPLISNAWVPSTYVNFLIKDTNLP